jgi:hypothetical protein
MNRLGWPVFAVIALALGETSAHYVFKYRAPSEAQWQTLKARLAPLHHSGDLVVIAPAWGEPLARQALGDTFMPLSVVARADDDDFARAIEIEFLSQHRSDLSAWPELRRESVGPFTLRVRRNPHYVAAHYQFTDHVDDSDLTVSVSRGGVEGICPFIQTAAQRSGGFGGEPMAPTSRHNCPGGTFHWVGVTLIEDEQYRPRRCIWSPPDDTGNIKLTFHHVPLGRELVGHAGTPWLRARDDIRQFMTISVTAAQHALGSLRLLDKDGWTRFSWDTQVLQDTSAEVQVAISSTALRAQWVCFTLESR